MNSDSSAIIEHAISQLLTTGIPKGSSCYTEEAFREIVSKTVSGANLDEFVDRYFDVFLNDLVDEFNLRLNQGLSNPFDFTDTEGKQLAVSTNYLDKKFRSVLDQIDDREFEKLCACMLIELGCKPVYLTGESHDQGVDGFGYYDVSCRGVPAYRGLVFVQAKHFKKCVISSKDIREYVGSIELARDGIWATLKAKYPSLTCLKYTPFSLVYVTSGRVKKTVEVLGRKSGVIVFTGDDLFKMFGYLTTPNSMRGYLKKAGAALKNAN